MRDLSKTDSLITYEFSAQTWKPEGDCTWYFVSLPSELAKEIRAMRKFDEEGWGRLKVAARIGDSEWKTAIWFDTKHETYLLPIKAEIRRKEKIEIGDNVGVMICL